MDWLGMLRNRNVVPQTNQTLATPKQHTYLGKRTQKRSKTMVENRASTQLRKLRRNCELR